MAYPVAEFSVDAMRFRVMVHWVNIMCPGGAHVISVYMHCSVGLGFQKMIPVTRARRGWNVEPATLVESGFVTLVQGFVCVTGSHLWGERVRLGCCVLGSVFCGRGRRLG